jgi:hypothetical protein
MRAFNVKIYVGYQMQYNQIVQPSVVAVVGEKRSRMCHDDEANKI